MSNVIDMFSAREKKIAAETEEDTTFDFESIVQKNKETKSKEAAERARNNQSVKRSYRLNKKKGK